MFESMALVQEVRREFPGVNRNVFFGPPRPHEGAERSRIARRMATRRLRCFKNGQLGTGWSGAPLFAAVSRGAET